MYDSKPETQFTSLIVSIVERQQVAFSRILYQWRSLLSLQFIALAFCWCTLLENSFVCVSTFSEVQTCRKNMTNYVDKAVAGKFKATADNPDKYKKLTNRYYAAPFVNL